MELNAEQIIKALECCSSKIGCKECPLQPKESLAICVTQISKYAFKEICRLTEENDRYFLDLQEQIDKNEEAEEIIKELTEENERLEDNLIKQSTENIMLLIERQEIKADTVRKMQEKIEALFRRDFDYTTISRFDVNKIAKEMLEGNNES